MLVDTGTQRIFVSITSRPLLTLALALIVIAITASGLTRLVKDTSVKAFIPPGHESLIADAKAANLFGMSDTIAVAVVTKSGGSVFTPEILALIARLTEQISDLENIQSDRVSSLATESSISGDEGAVFVEPYLDTDALDADFVADARMRWLGMSPHQGSLVSDDESGAVIMAELVDSGQAANTYREVLALASEIESNSVQIHVAGPAAVSGYLSSYIDQDARKLQPLVFALVLGFIFLAFRRFSALPGPLIVVVGAAGGALGIMAWLDIPYYAITNALPVIIVAISVADGIHILSSFYKHREQQPKASDRELVVAAMTDMARPITLTTITTIAGFVGIALMSIMPPIRFFALFASLGVFLAWAFSVLVLPNVLLLVSPGRSPAFKSWQHNQPSTTGRFLARIGALSPLRYRGVMMVFVVVTLVTVSGALKLRLDRSQVENFAVDEPIRIADEIINERFAGTAFLDIIIETDEPDGALRSEVMEKVRSLQQYMEQQPFVTKTVSLVDYLAQLHGAIENLSVEEIAARTLPPSDAGIAETLFVYEVSGDPTDFEEEIDADYQRLLVRGVLNAHYFSETKQTVEAMAQYIEENFNEPGVTASLTGDVDIGYNWMISLQNSHFKGVLLSLILVLTASMIVFRSTIKGIISVVPVAVTVLALYACMGYLGIYLEPATSMFAAIAIGVGVDFAIHLVDGLHKSMIEHDGDLTTVIQQTLSPIARACFFNSAALGIGFAVLLTSELPTLIRFGGLITVASFSSFLAALLFVPALFTVEKALLGHRPVAGQRYLVPVLLLLVAAVLLGASRNSNAASDDQAQRISEAVANRTEGIAMRRVIEMELVSRRGRVESRTAIVHKQSEPDVRKTRITFVEPQKSRDVTFLSHDYYAANASDDRWMYLPTSRRVRRIPASKRGNAFLGTDFSYEDIQSELKFPLADWNFEYEGEEAVAGRVRYKLRGTPSNQRIAKELGYGAFSAVIDEQSWMPVRIDFVDLKSRDLKTIEVLEFEQIDGIWTARRVLAINHQTGHKTEFAFHDVKYHSKLNDDLFKSHTLSRGLSE